MLQLTTMRIGRPLRLVLRWQFGAAAAGAAVAGMVGGRHAALSALAGGLIPWVAGWGYAATASRATVGAVGDTLRILIRAESIKVGLIVMQLWLVFTAYRQVVIPALLATFVIGIAIFSMAIAVRDR